MPGATPRPILVVEDDVQIRQTVVELLDLEGYPVEEASNGREALQIVDRVHPRLVILDMRMPVLNGWDFVRILQERGISLRILVMTAAQDARKWAEEVGAIGFLAKPFDLIELLDAIEKYESKNGNGNGSTTTH